MQNTRTQESITCERRCWLESMKCVENKFMVFGKSDEMRVTRTEKVFKMISDSGHECSGIMHAVQMDRWV